MKLGDETWPDVDPRERLLVVPLGSCEQHGPHLPLDTDLRIAVAVADSLAMLRSDVELGPLVPLGELLPDLRASELRSITPNGVLGDPASASAEDGARLLDRIAADLDRAVDAWTGDSPANRRATKRR